MMDKQLMKYQQQQQQQQEFKDDPDDLSDGVIRLVPTLEDANENITDPFSQLSDMEDEALDSYSALEDMLYNHGCKILTKWLEETLRLSRSRLKCRLMAPADLCSQIAADVLLKSESEPAGIRGCVLHLMYSQDSNSETRHLAEIVCDHTSVCTFILTVTLVRDKDFWLNLRSQLPFFNRKPSNNKDTIILSPKYEILKNKLYRSSSEES